MSESNTTKARIKDATCTRLYCLNHSKYRTNYRWKLRVRS